MQAVEFHADGHPELAAEIIELIGQGERKAFPDQVRAFDHGAWMPLHLCFGEDRFPVVQLSLPANETARGLMDIGSTLRGETGCSRLAQGTVPGTAAEIAGEVFVDFPVSG